MRAISTDRDASMIACGISPIAFLAVARVSKPSTSYFGRERALLSAIASVAAAIADCGSPRASASSARA